MAQTPRERRVQTPHTQPRMAPALALRRREDPGNDMTPETSSTAGARSTREEGTARDRHCSETNSLSLCWRIRVPCASSAAPA